MRIGIGVSTTPNRDVLDMDKFLPLLPKGSLVISICDNNFDGVAVTKNKLLALLDGCDHIFLFDDDTRPLVDGWWIPYVEHKEPHLMYQFKLPGKPESDMSELYRDEKTVAYSHTRGAMIYIDRKVLDVVGGMDTRYYNGFEHPDWTNRIHNAGLTTHRAMDVPDSHELLYCLDQDGEIKSSIPRSSANRVKNASLYRKSKNSSEYKEFR